MVSLEENKGYFIWLLVFLVLFLWARWEWLWTGGLRINELLRDVVVGLRWLVAAAQPIRLQDGW